MKRIILGICCIGMLGSSIAMQDKATHVEEKENAQEACSSLASSACDNNNIEELRNMFSNQGIDINSEKARSELFFAIEQGNVDVVKFFLEYPGFDVNTKDKEMRELRRYRGPSFSYPEVRYYFRTPLYVAAEQGQSEIVKLLLQNPKLDVNLGSGCKCYPEEYSSPLCIAAKNGHTEVVKLLLTHPNIDLNAGHNRDVRTPLCLAAEYGHADVVELLLAHPNIDVNMSSLYFDEFVVNYRGWLGDILTLESPLWFATKNGHTEVMKLLLSHPDVDVNLGNYDRQGSPLCIAVRQGNIDAVRLLLRHADTDVNAMRYFEPDDSGEYYHDKVFELAIHMAVSNRNKDIVELLSSREDIKIFEHTFTKAVRNKDEDIVELLYDKYEECEQYCDYWSFLDEIKGNIDYRRISRGKAYDRVISQKEYLAKRDLYSD